MILSNEEHTKIDIANYWYYLYSARYFFNYTKGNKITFTFVNVINIQ
jgi:hypothetical protein